MSGPIRTEDKENGDALSEKGNGDSTPTTPSDQLSLDTLPPEILLHIIAYIDAHFVIKTLSRVCRFFHALINDDTTWRVRIGRRWPQQYPPIPISEEEGFSWKQACIEREEHYRLFSNHQNTLDHFQYKDGIYAAVDAVHLMKGGTLLAAGSRDRYLNILNLEKLESGNPQSVKETKLCSIMNAHKGWVWSLDSLGNSLASGSWDTLIKFWDLEAGGAEVQKAKCNSAVLSLNYGSDMLIGGCYDQKVYLIDPRSCEVIKRLRYHKKPVLCLAVDDDFIITGSEDKTVTVYDKRAAKVYKTIEMESFCMSMSYQLNQLWVGDKCGQMHLFDPRHGDFSLIQSYESGHKGKLTGIYHSLGSIMTCSTDKTLRIHEPNLNPGLIGALPHDDVFSGLAFQNDTLAAACGDCSIGIWRPKDPRNL